MAFGWAKAGIGAAQLGRHVGMVYRKAFDVRLVNNRLMPLSARMAVIAPVKVWQSHHAIGHEGALSMSLDGPSGLSNEYENTAGFHFTWPSIALA